MDFKRKYKVIETENSDSETKTKRPTQQVGLTTLNALLMEDAIQNYVQQNWKDTPTKTSLDLLNDFEKSALEMIRHPFKLCILKNFLNDPKYLRELKEELLQVELVPKCNDLYQYHQSADLSTINFPSIVSLRELMLGQFRKWISLVTGKELLKDKITMNCSTYNYTDYLLCHDDQTDDRLIAFVLYLNSDKWSDLDGGKLEMFDSDENLQPKDVVKSILPMHNSFIFFEVTSQSFHQVSEVLTADRTRLSINGWYHGIPNSAPKAYLEPDEIRSLAVPKPKSYDMSLINQLFLATDVQASISTQFEDLNEILLAPFLNTNKFLTVASDLKCKDISWKLRGPANRRRYEVAEIDSLPDSVRALIDVFQSEPMFGLLQKYTNIVFEKSEDQNITSNPTCHVEVQRWSEGCYTLIHDDDRALSQSILDASFYFEPVKIFQGGFTSYIARDDDEELLTVAPSPNGLALTYRDEETLRFVKYVNNRLGNDVFHTISLTYKELIK